MSVIQPDTLFTLACDEFGKHFIDYDTADKLLDNLEFNPEFRKKILYDFDEDRNMEGFYDNALELHWENTRDFFSVTLKGGEKRHCLMTCFYGGVEVGHVMICIRFFPVAGVQQKRTLVARCRAKLPHFYRQCFCIGEACKSNFCDRFPHPEPDIEPPAKKQKMLGPFFWF
jgi:hypothetical protein